MPSRQDPLGRSYNPTNFGGEVEVRALACYLQFCDDDVNTRPSKF